MVVVTVLMQLEHQSLFSLELVRFQILMLFFWTTWLLRICEEVIIMCAD